MRLRNRWRRPRSFEPYGCRVRAWCLVAWGLVWGISPKNSYGWACWHILCRCLMTVVLRVSAGPPPLEGACTIWLSASGVERKTNDTRTRAASASGSCSGRRSSRVCCAHRWAACSEAIIPRPLRGTEHVSDWHRFVARESGAGFLRPRFSCTGSKKVTDTFFTLAQKRCLSPFFVLL